MADFGGNYVVSNLWELQSPLILFKPFKTSQKENFRSLML